MSSKTTKTVKVASILLMVFLLTLSAVSEEALADDTVIIGQSAEASGLHILVEIDSVAFERLNLINEPLIRFNADLELQPHLASNWELVDATRIDIELREGVKWHHGRELVAEDVKYTFDWILDEDNPAANRNMFDNIEEVEVIDDYNLVFHLSEPFAFMINNIARAGIVPYDYHEEVGYEEFGQEPIGTGPYVHEEWRADEHHSMTAFTDYWQGEPNFSRLKFVPIPEDSSRLLAFEAGEIDMFQGGIVPMDLKRLEESDDVNVYRTPGTGYVHLAMNTTTERNPELLQDRYFRRAFTHLIDREAIVEQVMEGIGAPGKSNLTPQMPHFNDEIDYPAYDPETAQEYLDKSVLEPGDSLELYVDQDSVNLSIAEILAYELEQFDIELEIISEEWGALVDRITQSNDYDLYFGSWTGQTDPDRASYRQFHSQGNANHTSFSNERLDELLERGRTVDPTSDESIEIYKEVQEILIDQVPTNFLYYYEEIAIVQPEFEGFQAYPYSSITWLQLIDSVERVE
ncbi:ABC transporter substrate-binding protein [Halanaerobiaceae bacterium Z-7014]|uniref:ABC transporter substrate-binding protein n=1 Tax=Halonatronomonas betaini TaxID=2778430 RepID=A0A931AP66_9FIRM|nr:ABC transporter substrate-binding protein [Halonatronomonas betaini]MBF8435484.1 ABC transporter substrate-binding protein [Halonatronomonas betaini]